MTIGPEFDRLQGVVQQNRHGCRDTDRRWNKRCRSLIIAETA